MMDLARSVGQDVRHAVRLWWKSPGLSLTVLASLTLSIGAATAVFTFFDVLLLRPLPVRVPAELYAVGPAAGGNLDLNPTYFSYPFYKELTHTNTAYADLFASSVVVSSGVNLTAGSSTERLRAELVSGNYFRVLGVSSIAGRVLSEDDDRLLGAQPVVVLSHSAWRRWFDGRPDVTGQTIRLNGLPYTVIGVAPESFFGTRVGFSPDVWAPLAMTEQLSAGLRPSNNANYVELGIRLAPGVSVTATSDALTTAYRDWIATNDSVRGDTRASRPLRTLRLVPAGRGLSLLRGQYGQPLVILLAGVGVLLAIACANISNLLLARGLARRREMAIRVSQGATRLRMVRQLVTECLVLATAGGILGWCASLGLGRALLAFLPSNAAPWQFSPNARAFLFTTVVVVVTGFVSGLVPSRIAARLDVYHVLRRDTVDANPAWRWLDAQSVLSALQVALSLMLVVASVLFARSLRNIRSVETGFDQSHVLLAALDPVKSGYSKERTRAFYDALLDGLRHEPGVRAVGLASYGSLSSVLAAGTRFLNTTMHGAGQQLQPDDDATVWMNMITAGYFDAVGLPLRGGRDFSARDDSRVGNVAIVNETAARYFFGMDDPVGKRIGSVRMGDADIEVVGVVADAKYLDLREASRRIVYRPHAQAFRSLMTLHVRAASDPAALAPTLERDVRALDPALPLFQVQTMRGRMDESLRQERLVATLAGALATLGTALAMVGLYGVVSYAVTRRTRELAVRLALGASAGHVLSTVLWRTFAIALAGIVIGVPLTLVCSQLFHGFLFGIPSDDPVTMMVAVGVLLLLTLGAGYVPARRALRIDPMTALRQE
jgi:predicted permease